MPRNIDPSNGGGPWPLDVPDLGASEATEYHLDRMRYSGRKAYFSPWLPLDNVTLKNRTTDVDLLAEFNGQYSMLVEPNAVATFEEVGITSIRLENLSSTALDGDDVVLAVAKDPYDADDAARVEANRSAVEKVVRGWVGL